MAMTEWFFPITLLPGVGLLIMSTSNLAMGLSNELAMLITDEKANREIVKAKIRQLSRLNRSLTALYVSCAMLVISGLIGGITPAHQRFLLKLAEVLVFISIGGILVGLLLLMSYSARAAQIKKQQFEERI
ncbi:MAG: hypothetical protein AAGA85_18565 [Bacteroidota bacterium]